MLTLSDIAGILNSNPHKKMIDAAQSMRCNLRMHMFGDGLAQHLAKINSFENADQYAVRKKYARSNADMIERITRPIDKVFSAAGGSTYYNLPESRERELRNRLRDVENGLPLRKWMEQYWKPAYLADPMGLIYMEIDGNGEAYPTYKSSGEIYTYKLNGRHLDYVIFNVRHGDGVTLPDGLGIDTSGRGNYYRVVDERFDYLVKWENSNASIIEDGTYPNHFGFVPAIIASDIPVFGSDLYCSPLHNILGAADEFLRENSVKIIYKLLHGFPKSWEYGGKCPECDGIGRKGGDTCHACKGTGVRLRADVADTRILQFPQSKDDPTITPDVAGYVTPPIDAWNKMGEELKLLETQMFETLWGTKQVEDAANETATGRFIDTQPVNDRLSKFAEAAETIEKFITDAIGGLYYGAAYGGASVNYGRRFQIETPDALWDKYRTARASGAPEAMLDDILKDYIQSKYDNNSLEMQRQLKLIALEPFVHLTISQVRAHDVSEDDYLRKLYFGSFLASISERDVLAKSRDELNEELTIFTQTKKTNENTRGIDPDRQ